MMATNNGLSELALPLESTKRLNAFRRQLASDRTKVQFDDRVLKVLLEYAYSPSYVQDTRKYLNGLKDPDGFSFSRSLKLGKELRDNIKSFSSDNHPSFRWNKNYQKALEKVRREFAVYHLAPISYTCDQDIADSLPKLDTHAGWTYIQTGRRSKGENLDGAYLAWCAEADKAVLCGSFNKPILPGTRTQGSGEFENDGTRTNTCKHKTRLVSMIDFYQILTEVRFARPFQNVIQTRDFYAGGKNGTQTSSIIAKYRSQYSEYVSLDYSKFDQSISDWLIYDAFDIIRSCFGVLSEYDQKLWDAIVHDFVHKTFISDKGQVYSHKGVPSGSMFTQIIDSLVNRVMIETYLLAMNIDGQMMVMGDDNLLYYNMGPGSHDIRDSVASYLSKNFGVECSAKKSDYGSRFKHPNFLSREWRFNGQWRHPSILISKLLFSERYRNYNENPDMTPELIVYSYILAYGIGMAEFFDVKEFLRRNNLNPQMLSILGSKYLPGKFNDYLYNHNDLMAFAA